MLTPARKKKIETRFRLTGSKRQWTSKEDIAMAHTSTFDHPDRHPVTPHATDWRAAAWAGLIAGIVFMMAEMLMVMLVKGESPWGPPHMMAAMILGKGVLPPPADFTLTIMMAAMAVHVPLSIVYGLAIGWLAHRFEMGVALAIGVAAGLAIYFVNFYPIAAIVFPWFAMARGAMSAVAHVLFGLVAGGAYIALRRRPQSA